MSDQITGHDRRSLLLQGAAGAMLMASPALAQGGGPDGSKADAAIAAVRSAIAG